LIYTILCSNKIGREHRQTSQRKPVGSVQGE
jgi:hypothetical protein